MCYGKINESGIVAQSAQRFMTLISIGQKTDDPAFYLKSESWKQNLLHLQKGVLVISKIWLLTSWKTSLTFLAKRTRRSMAFVLALDMRVPRGIFPFLHQQNTHIIQTIRDE